MNSNQIQHRILYLINFRYPIAERDLLRSFDGKSRPVVSDQIASMIDRGLVIRQGKGIKSDPIQIVPGPNFTPVFEQPR